MADFQSTDNGSELSLDEITNELEALISLANEGNLLIVINLCHLIRPSSLKLQGQAFDDKRMDVLIALRDEHPVYKQKLFDEKILFREVS